MKLEGYKKYFLKGDWHTHSTFSDGDNTPEEMVKTAIDLDLKLIAITEHVNRKTDWLDDFCEEIRRLKKKYEGKIKVLSGIEAKVIDLRGNIDARAKFFDNVDIVLTAFHRIPTSHGFIPREQISKKKLEVLEHWHKAMLNVLKNTNVDIIAHPTNLLKIHDIAILYLVKKEIAESANKNKKIFEINIKHDVPDKEFIGLLEENNVPMIRGSDAHHIQELKEYHEKY